MSANAIEVRLAIVGDMPMPECRLGGTDGSIPYMRWKGDADGWCAVELTLGGHPDPGTYLRDLAHQLLAFAHDVDQARGKREPSGYDAPIPYKLAEHVHLTADGVHLTAEGTKKLGRQIANALLDEKRDRGGAPLGLS